MPLISGTIPIDLHSTGTTNSAWNSAIGGVDPYWTVALGPVGFEGGPARIVEMATEGPAERNGAAWVWVHSNGGGAYPHQTYSFRNFIDLTSFVAEEIEIEFYVSTRNAFPFFVAVNGQGIEVADLAGCKFRYVIPPPYLKKAINTIDILVRVDEPSNPSPSSSPSCIKVEFVPASGKFDITKAACRSCDVRSVGDSQVISVTAKIEPPTSPGQLFVDMSIPLDPPAKVSDKLTVSAQIVTLDSENGFAFPKGPELVYTNNTAPQSMLTARVLGFSETGDEIYLRIWSHPLFMPLSPISIEPLAGGRPHSSRPGKIGDPPAWPTNSGVVVVVADSGGGGVV